MRRRFFQQNMRAILLPVIIPAIILGIVAIWLIHFYYRTDIEKQNTYRVQNISDNLDSLVNELNRININLSNSPAIVVRLKRILSQSGLGIKADDHILINTIIDLLYSSTSINEYVHSLYIYLNNPNGYFISNNNGLVRFEYFHDITWHDSYLVHTDEKDNVWSELRKIPSSPKSSDKITVLSIYRKVYASAKDNPDGVLVLNVKVEDINKTLNSLDIPEAQSVVIANKHNGDILFNNSTWTLSDFTKDDIKGVFENTKTSFATKINGENNVVNVFESSLYNWKCISFIPAGILYRLPDLLTRIIVFIILITTFIGTAISYFFACRNYEDIQSIIKMIDCAVNGRQLPDLPPMSFDIHSYIIHNVLKTFIENSYLQVQLSEKHYHMKTLELIAMQSQLNPHFLFNIMETLYWKAIAFTGEPNEFTAIIENLSDILRYVLHSDEETVELSREIQITNSYLDIQSIRYKDKFEVIWDYPAYLNDVKIMKLIFQPLVENCIYHGIRHKERASLIKIRIRRLGDTLRISVVDSGTGMDRETLESIRHQLSLSLKSTSEHIGLFNTNKRIKLLYGEQYGLKVLSRQNVGTAVRIVLPLQKEEDQGIREAEHETGEDVLNQPAMLTESEISDSIRKRVD